MSTYARRAAEMFKRAFLVRPTERIIDWARQWIKISSEESGDFPGDYNPDLNPLPTILFDLYESGRYDEVIVKKDSQSGFTLIVFIFICWWAKFINRNFLYAIDSEEEVEKIGSQRLLPLIQACEPLKSRVRAGSDPFTKVLLKFAGLTGYLIGGRSLGKASNKSIGLAIVDEISAIETKLSAAAVLQWISEIRARLKKQSHSFFINFSKAGEWEGLINQEYLCGTQHKVFVPCPHCTAKNGGEPDGFQVIEWEQIKFGHCKDERGRYDRDRVLKEAYCECIHCKCAIMESHKPWMLQRRQARQTNFGEDPDHLPVPRRASVENTVALSTFPKLTWGHVACKFIDALGNPELLKNFFKDYWARPDKKHSIKTDESIIYKMTAGYHRGQCPVLPRKIIMGVDKQKTVWKWVKAGFTWEGDCYVIDWGQVINRAALIEEADRPVEITHWPDAIPLAQRTPPTTFCGFVDERYSQLEVRDFVISTWMSNQPDGTPNYRFHGCYGLARHTARSLKDIVSPGAIARPNVIHNNRPMWSYAISVDNFNHEIHNMRFGQFRLIEAALRDRKEAPPHIRRIWFPQDIFNRDRGDEEEFVRQITRETHWFNPAKHRWEWKDVDDNDYGDGLRICHAGWYLLAPLENAPIPISPPPLTATEQKQREYVLNRAANE